MDQEVDYEVLPNSSMATNMMAGALAGITEHTCLYPFDSIKTRMQVVNPNPQALYTSLFNAISKISSTEGLSNLWRGVGSVVAGAGPSHALYFATYEYCKVLFGADTNEHNFIGTGAAGALATIAADGFMNPFDVIKQRLQLHGSVYKSVYDCGRSIFQKEGIAAFYLSYPTTLTMTVPYQSIHFMAYEFFRKSINPTGKYDPKSHVISGGLAGAIAAGLTNPLDVCKTLLQTKGISSDAAILKANGMKDAFNIIYSRYGVKGFFRGMTPRMFSHMPSTAICWTTYEFLKHMINSQMNSPINSSPIDSKNKLAAANLQLKV